MELEIFNLINGKYGLFNDTLVFETGGINKTFIRINKKAALEIMHTLLDSVCLLDDNTEDLLSKIEERISMV